MSDETTLYFNLDDEDNEKRVVVRVSELVRCLKHFRESLLCNGGDYEHDMRETGGHLKAATLGSGTLTAEQVLTIAGKHQPDYCSDTHVCFDWQAIADELNATLGGGECECEGTIEWKWTGPTTYYEHELSCGHVITSVDNEPPNFCEECGRKILKAVER